MRFEAFSLSHWAALAAAALTVAAIFAWRDRLRRPGANRTAKYGLAAVLAGSEVALQISYVIRGTWSVYSLPFELCSLTLWLSAALLLTGKRWLYEAAFFLGTLGTLQALLTPDLNDPFPSFYYFHFFIGHIAILAASVFMTAVDRFRPTFRSMLRALVWLHALAIPAAVADIWAGTNFMFLAHKPRTASMLDLLSPWPWYLLELEAVAFVLCFALLGAVKAADRWTRRKRGRSGRSGSSGREEGEGAGDRGRMRAASAK
ncbi:TIGR02206 family membrane protein [Cohnella lubricantis]|uniref:TIGR02206 family membrane protein n=1 Tax=Cohnella lubricantis TaxID=2163172 RepID=A0A841TJW9_9BACL|nr:TIGR02206 family membrane protein [Cohnella lubricantis]MBB6679490.1 TIGR02206 family membrane protein [Cohnella lubricantis]MBP2118756.1 putative integral membrane protein (TIGR02206 family) [Cohnella lubricantis]